MSQNAECVPEENIEIIEIIEYKDDLLDCFNDLPDVAQPLIKRAKKTLLKIEKLLYTSSAFINIIKSSMPEYAFNAILTDSQKQQIAKGSIKLMTKKNGSIMANLVNTKTNKIVSTVSLKEVKITPELSQSIANFSTQMQMAQIAEQIQEVQLAIEEVRQGQEFDRLATAYSCQQKLLQAVEIKNEELKSAALLRIALDSEDSRNLLMQSQIANLTFIKEQPENFFKKLISGSNPEKINQRMGEIRESLNAVNMVSLVEAMAYQEMGELEAAQQSLKYYSNYIQTSYLNSEGFVERLDLIDPSPENYWSKILPEISNKIQSLPSIDNTELLEGE